MEFPLKGNRVGPALLPLKNVKTLPSKWEDAERWIFSPAYGENPNRQQFQQHQYHRKPKAKSGPLGAPGSAYYLMYTQDLPMSDRRNEGDQMGNSPFSTELMGTKKLSTSYDDLRKGSQARFEPSRSVSLRGSSVELPGQSSLPSSHVSAVEKEDKMNDNAIDLSCPVSRRDIATQMSPSDSTNSSFKRISSSQNEEQSHPSLLKMRDVEMDEKIITLGSLKNIHRDNQNSRNSRQENDSMKKTLVNHTQSSAWGCKDTSNSHISTRDEARIIAWENLQKAKADAAIQKLEMKLEKKKVLSMDKIMKKLKSAQKKAQEMKMSVISNRLGQGTKPSSARRNSYTSKVSRMSLLSGCFTCHAFYLV